MVIQAHTPSGRARGDSARDLIIIVTQVSSTNRDNSGDVWLDYESNLPPHFHYQTTDPVPVHLLFFAFTGSN